MSALSLSHPDPDGGDPSTDDVDAADPLVSCTACGTPLELSQPDPQRPENLLGACPRCAQWHQVQIQTLGIV